MPPSTSRTPRWRRLTGRCICHKWFRRQAEVDDVVAMVRNLYAGRVTFHDGSGESRPASPSISSAATPCGLQIVRVHTARGFVVLASDAVHLLDESRRAQLRSRRRRAWTRSKRFRIVEELAEGRDHIIPGHDPLVLAASRRCAATSISCAWICRRLFERIRGRKLPSYLK